MGHGGISVSRIGSATYARRTSVGAAGRAALTVLVAGAALAAPAFAEAGQLACPALPAGALSANAAPSADGQPAPVPLPDLAADLHESGPVDILAIGSSSTEGIGASGPAFTYPAQLQANLRAAWQRGDITVANAGIGGEIASRAVERMDAALEDHAYALVVWQVGTNDVLRNVDEAAFRADVEHGLEAAEAAETDILLFDPQFYQKAKDQAHFQRFNAIVADVARTHHVPLFSRYAFMKAIGTSAPATLDAMLSRDGMHMSDFGYKCLADRLTDIIRTLTAPPQVADARPAAPQQLAATAAALPR
nr:GDSL-type esterase/lipase family protein [Propylenella binzhouense]